MNDKNWNSSFPFEWVSTFDASVKLNVKAILHGSSLQLSALILRQAIHPSKGFFKPMHFAKGVRVNDISGDKISFWYLHVMKGWSKFQSFWISVRKVALRRMGYLERVLNSIFHSGLYLFIQIKFMVKTLTHTANV